MLGVSHSLLTQAAQAVVIQLSKSIRQLFFLSALLTVVIPVLAQNRTITSAGNWSNTAIWSGGNRADVIGENVTADNSLGGSGLVTVDVGYTVGNVNTGNNNDFLVDDNITLSIGSTGNARDLTIGESTVFTVDAGGNLTIWGDLIIPDDYEVTFNVAGTITIHGDIVANDNGAITVNGTGTFTVNGDIDIPDDGELTITANRAITIGGDVDLNDDGNFVVNGTALLTVQGNLNGGDDIFVDVNGLMTVQGDFDGGDGVDVDVDGTFTLNGDFNVSDDLDMTIDGTFNVGGYFDADQNADIDINGALDITGDFIVEDDLLLTVDGSFEADDFFFEDADGPATITITGDFTIHDDFDSSDIDDLNFNVRNGGVADIGDDFIVDDDFDLDVDAGGQMTIGDDFVSEDNADLINDGTIVIGDDISTVSGTGSSVTGGQPITFGGTCSGDFCTDSQLPIILKSFTANLVAGEVQLTWVTLMEQNFQKFVIEHSVDGISFVELGSVKGSGSDVFNIETHYSFTDALPMIGHNYYRLRAVDFDGFTETFEVVSVLYRGEKQFNVYSNPAGGKSVQFKINFENGPNDRMIVMDQVGAVLADVSITHQSGQVEFHNALSPGIYIVKYKGSDFEMISRLVVR